MQEQVVASDEAYVVVENSPNEELENRLLEETVQDTIADQGPTAEEIGELAYKVVQALQQVHQSGDTFAAIAVHPSIAEAFTEAFRGLPDEVIGANIRENLPIIPEEKANPLKIITGTDIELQFFQVKYGPREQGGNGLLQDMQAALERERSPVRVTHEFLRFYYLMDLAEKASPKLYTPTGSDVLRNLSPTLGRR